MWRKRTGWGIKVLLIGCETKALADDILISGINSYIFSHLFALIWRTLGLVTFLWHTHRFWHSCSTWNVRNARIISLPQRGPRIHSSLGLSWERGPFLLDTDASNVGIGAVLSQVHQASHALSKPERNYYTTRQELVAIVKAIDHFHPFLYGQKFTIRTNHASLQWLLNFKNPEGQIARWLDKLQTYDFCIVYHTGRSYQNADVLSHRPCFDTNCKHCQNQEQKHATENAIGMPNDCVVNLTQAHVSEGPQSPSASLPREGKEVRDVDQPEDEQLSPLQFRTHQMERKTIYHILGWKEAGKRPE